MADPRAANNFNLVVYPHQVATFVHDDTIVYDADEAGGSAQVGLAVTIESSNVVSLVGNNENVLGKLISVEADGFCTVQHSGFMTLPGGTSATLTAGTKIMGDLLVAAEGYIQIVATQHTISRGMIIDSSVTTAVVVLL